MSKRNYYFFVFLAFLTLCHSLEEDEFHKRKIGNTKTPRVNTNLEGELYQNIVKNPSNRSVSKKTG
jgi:hypothetical protein